MTHDEMNPATENSARRPFLKSIGLALAALTGMSTKISVAADKPAAKFPITKTEAEWRKQLTPAQFDVLREEGTERPYSSPLNKEHRAGKFSCAGCNTNLFSSKTKFESGTGWPSFWQPLPSAVGEVKDRSFGMVRTAVNCATCGGHLGHVFDDGPKPTGLRYCMNGVAMTFTPGEA